MARGPKQSKANLATFFLARHSGLFRPGAEFLLVGMPAAKRDVAREDKRRRPYLGGVGGGGGAFVLPDASGGIISLAVRYGLYAPNNPVGWPAGTVTAPMSSGTPTWSLVDNDGGNFQIDAGTGVISKLAATTIPTGTRSVTVAVTGLTPNPGNTQFFIPVAPSLDFSQPGNSMLI